MTPGLHVVQAFGVGLALLPLMSVLLIGCQSTGPDTLDPHRLPEFGERTAPSGRAEPNDDPQNDDVAVGESLVVTCGGQQLVLPDGASRSARRLVQLFQSRPQLVGAPGSERVLELGAGTGLAGLAAVTFGARVDFTDQLPVMDTLRANVLPNLAPRMRERVRFAALQWGEADDSHPFADTRYDVILAADLVYAKEAMMPLVETIRRFGGPTTITYLAYVQRFPWARRFFDEMQRSHERELLDLGDGVWIFAFRPRRRD